MSYAYGMKGAPSVGGGLPGLPRRRSGVGGPITLARPGERIFDTPGVYEWVVPKGVYSISIVCVGGGQGGRKATGGLVQYNGQGGDGGSLAYANDVLVSPGEVFVIRVGKGGNLALNLTDRLGGTSGIWVPYYRTREGSLYGHLLDTGAAGSPVSSERYGTVSRFLDGLFVPGGVSGSTSNYSAGGGGGAAGYAEPTKGAGGAGAPQSGAPRSGSSGENGGGGGGASGRFSNPFRGPGGAGGGVGIFGMGANGAGGTGYYHPHRGNPGEHGSIDTGSDPFGGGGSGDGWMGGSDGPAYGGSAGMNGAVRIIWPGHLRKFPSLRTLPE